jgi:rare lipoprotein A
MPKKSSFNRTAGFVVVLIIGNCGIGFAADAQAEEKRGHQHSASSSHPKTKHNRSGQNRIGQASVYAEKFAGKKMADGTKMNPRSDNAASKTLPLGTTAKVTNLQTGRSAKVTIRDRGPHVKGRILDVSPSTAHKIGITKNKGVARVHVIPIAAPKANDGVKSSTAAHKVKANKTAFTARRK